MGIWDIYMSLWPLPWPVPPVPAVPPVAVSASFTCLKRTATITHSAASTTWQRSHTQSLQHITGSIWKWGRSLIIMDYCIMDCHGLSWYTSPDGNVFIIFHRKTEDRPVDFNVARCWDKATHQFPSLGPCSFSLQKPPNAVISWENYKKRCNTHVSQIDPLLDTPRLAGETYGLLVALRNDHISRKRFCQSFGLANTEEVWNLDMSKSLRNGWIIECLLGENYHVYHIVSYHIHNIYIYI